MEIPLLMYPLNQIGKFVFKKYPKKIRYQIFNGNICDKNVSILVRLS